MKQIHFRIIELPTHQVLLTKDFDEDEDSTPLLVVTFFHEGVKANLKLGYSDEKNRDDMFEKYSSEQAEKIVNDFAGNFMS